MFAKLMADECGATLTTELVLLSTLTAAGILSTADNVRDGFRRKTEQLVQAISEVGSYSEATPPTDRSYQQFHCLVVTDPDAAQEQADGTYPIVSP